MSIGSGWVWIRTCVDPTRSAIDATGRKSATLLNVFSGTAPSKECLQPKKPTKHTKNMKDLEMEWDVFALLNFRVIRVFSGLK